MPTGPDLIANILAYEYNFVPLDETMYEYWLIDGEEMVFRIANSEHPSNALFLLDMSEFEE